MTFNGANKTRFAIRAGLAAALAGGMVALPVAALAADAHATESAVVATAQDEPAVDGADVADGGESRGMQFDGGEGTLENPYQIASVETFKAFRDNVNAGESYAKKYIKLTSNIDLNNEEWTPIGNASSKFMGFFDGGNFTVSNLKVTKGINADGANANVGLFGYTVNGELKDLNLHNAHVTGGLEVGAFVGTPYTSKMTNLKLTGDVQVSGYSYVGGMFGKNAYANLTNLTMDVEDGSFVQADSEAYRTYVGGLIGFMGEGNITVSNVTSNIDVKGSTLDVGGITGIIHYGNTFENCKVLSGVTVEVTAAVPAEHPADTLEIGGIAGTWMNDTRGQATIEDCSFGGSLKSTSSAGDDYTPFIADNVLVGKQYYNVADNSKDLKVIQNGVESIIPGTKAGLVSALGDIKDGQTIKIPCDVSADVLVKAGVNATINLAGHKITNLNGHTITVESGASLHIMDPFGTGVVDNTTHGKAALSIAEGAKVTLDGGTFKRSAEKGTLESKSANGNSYYTILNKGDLTINDGTTVQLLLESGLPAGFSSVIDNGWSSGSPSTDGYNAKLTVNGGVIEGGKYLKNDSYGVMVINGGEIKNGAAASILNWNDLTVNGGKFDPADGATGAVYNVKDGAPEKGTVEVKGGEFLTTGDQKPIFTSNDGNKSDSATIKGGSFTTEPNKGYIPDGFVLSESNGVYTVSVYVPPVTPPTPSDKTEVEKNPDGSTTTTVTKPDGSQTITHETATGTESVVKKDEDGNVTSTEVTVSKKDAESGKVELPLADAKPATDVDKAPEVEVKVPSSVTADKPVQVTVPVAKDEGDEPNYGIVVFAVDADGNEAVIPKCSVDKDGNVVFEAIGDVTIKVVDNARDMPDVTDADWFAGDVVDFATARGIVNGVDMPDGTKQFKGYDKTSRGMLVAMLHNLELNPEAASDVTLPDVPEGAFYADAAAWALEEGILSGVDMPDGSKQFQGGEDVTREQVAVFLMRYAEHLGMDVSGRAEIDFPDAGEVSGFAKDAMSWAVAEGLFTGDDVTGELNPTDGAARAEVAAVLMRFINLMYA